mgnify:CR=1 FL=1
MPQLVDFCLWVCDLGLCQQAEQFQVHHVQLNLTVGTLPQIIQVIQIIGNIIAKKTEK